MKKEKMMNEKKDIRKVYIRQNPDNVGEEDEIIVTSANVLWQQDGDECDLLLMLLPPMVPVYAHSAIWFEPEKIYRMSCATCAQNGTLSVMLYRAR